MDANTVQLFKALADSSRLKIISNLLAGPMYVELLAERLGVSPSTVSFHLKKLEEIGLVWAQRDQYYIQYALNRDMLSVTLIDLIGTQKDDEEQDERENQYRDKVLKAFFEYGRLKSIPVQLKKKRIVLEEIVKAFAPNRTYTEREVNIIIADIHDDFCTIRRDMVAEGLLARENGIYRLAEREDKGG